MNQFIVITLEDGSRAAVNLAHVVEVWDDAEHGRSIMHSAVGPQTIQESFEEFAELVHEATEVFGNTLRGWVPGEPALEIPPPPAAPEAKKIEKVTPAGAPAK